uniref:Uncharacterized protein n=1 Tax=Rhizophora mucronata TaxID=61149 RepID=A0A2P2NC50_RHIMU
MSWQFRFLQIFILNYSEALCLLLDVVPRWQIFILN